MANSTPYPFEATYGDVFGGLAQSAESCAPNQFSFSSNVDFFSEPGVLKPLPQLAGTALTLPSNTDSRIRAFTKVLNDTSYPYYAVSWSTSSLTTMRILKSSDMTTWQTATDITGADAFSASEPISIAEYNGDLFIHYVDYIDQWTNFPTVAASITNRAVSGQANKMLPALGFLYYLHGPVSVGSGGSIGRYDGSAFNDTAIQVDKDFNPVSADEWNDFLVIGAVHGISTTRGGLNSRLYVWDGVSNVFDKKVDIPSPGLMSVRNVNGVVHILCVDTNNNIRIYLWNGGTDVVLAETILTGASTTSRMKIDDNAVAVDGEFLIFGAKTVGFSTSLAIKRGVYGYGRYDAKTNRYLWCRDTTMDGTVGRDFYAIDIIDGVTLTTWYADNMSTTSTNAYRTSTSMATTSRMDFDIRSPDPMYRCHIKRAKIRHANLTSGTSIVLRYNRNQESSQGGEFTQLLASAGSSTDPGPGDSGTAKIRKFSVTQLDEGNVPTLDSFQLQVALNSSGSTGPKLKLPIVVQGEILPNLS